MVTGWTVVLRGIRYRAGRSLAVLLLATIATAATVLAPGYARAASESVPQHGLAGRPGVAGREHGRRGGDGGEQQHGEGAPSPVSDAPKHDGPARHHVLPAGIIAQCLPNAGAFQKPA